MLYHEPTNTEFNSVYDFKLANKDTSFGDLANEEERDAIGLYSVDEKQPSVDSVFYKVSPKGVILKESKYVRDWEIQQLPIEVMRSNLLKAIAAKRWQHETSGITLGSGIKVNTAVEDQNRITSVIANAELAGVSSINFKAVNAWVTLSIQDLKDIDSVITLHVQNCFSTERMHYEQISACTSAEELLSYNINEGWPS